MSDQTKDIEELRNQIKVMEVFQNFLININKKLEIKDLANYLISFLKQSFGVKYCSIIIENERYSLDPINDKKIIETENRVIKEIENNKELILLKNIRNDTLVHYIKNEHDLALISIPVLLENKIISILNIYDELKNINKKSVELLNYFLNKASPAICNSISHNKIKIKSYKDDLTSLYKRDYFFERLMYEITNMNKYISIMMVDIDYFKNYNDKNGHQLGDYLLKEISLLFKSNLRDKYLTCRYGGEEFIIALPETDSASALIIAERLRMNIENHNFKLKENQPEKKVTISIGLVTTITKEIDISDIVNEADTNLYKSKRSGRNKITHSIIINKNLSGDYF